MLLLFFPLSSKAFSKSVRAPRHAAKQRITVIDMNKHKSEVRILHTVALNAACAAAGDAYLLA